MSRLMIVVGSVRPGRVGLPVAEWARNAAVRSGRFDEVDFADLAAIDLPFMDEPQHPRLRQYEHHHTREWSAGVDAVDAVVLVTPEYNYGLAPAVKNALDYLHHEWAYKPVGFVSYGGVAGGTRSVQMTKQVVSALRMFPMANAVSIHFVPQFIDDDGVFQATESMDRAAAAMFDELVRVGDALRPLRERREAAV